MFRKPYLVLVALLVLAAGSIFLAAQKPGGAKGQTEGEAALPLVVEEAEETGAGKTPSGAQEAEMSAGQIRQALLERAKQHLFKPGWVLVRETLTDFTNAEAYVVVPMNGQIIPKNWVRETWLFVDQDLQVDAMYSEKKMFDGTRVSLTQASDGSIGKPANPEILPAVQSDYWARIEAVDRVIEQGGGQNAVFQLIQPEDRLRLQVTTQDVYPSPGRMDGVDQPVISFTSVDYYDWTTGQFLFSEGWATLIDGSRQLVRRLEMSIDANSIPPEMILMEFSTTAEE
ncbi:MAG: hypothetical protein ROW48_06510 [Bellilinea sp.]|jgi:hypothetical protein